MNNEKLVKINLHQQFFIDFFKNNLSNYFENPLPENSVLVNLQMNYQTKKLEVYFITDDIKADKIKEELDCKMLRRVREWELKPYKK